MTRRVRWPWVVAACATVAMLSVGRAGAGDTTKVEQATQQVAEGARSISYGEFASGFGDVFVGMGRTIVEGTVYAGKAIGEFFKKTLRKEPAGG